ncbi:sensor histidine kinase [Flammeovirga sp. OC4]|uniref:sensor histidine kinase n=1 Tax=Flammeovirga sp. OC4 TaxID=1382345 RepID=UPI0005C4AE1D|nr:sensor histidine kinase [Flammeovirga sp. OC4]
MVNTPLFGQELFMHHWTKKDGLAHNYTFLMKEHKGKLWIGTDDGLSVFDGKSFKNYTIKDGLKSPYVIGFNENYSDSLYLFTWRGGIHVFDETADSIKTYPYLQKGTAEKLHKGLRIKDDIYGWQWNASFYFNEKTRKSKNLYFYTSDSTMALSYAKDLRRNITPLDFDTNTVPLGFARYQNKMLVFGLLSKGIKIIEDAQIKGEFFQESLGDKVISGFNKTNDGGALAGTRGMIYKLNPNGDITDSYKLPTNSYPSKMYQLANGSIVAAIHPKNYTQQCIIIHPTKKTYFYLEKKLRIKSASSGIYVDSQDRIWLTTQGDGIYMVENLDFKYINIEDIESPHILAINQLDSSKIIFSSTTKSYIADLEKDSISIYEDVPFKDIYISEEDSLKVFSTYTKTFNYENELIPVLWGEFVGKNKGGLWFMQEDSLKVFQKDKLGKYQLQKVFWRFPKGNIEIPNLSSAVIQENKVWVTTKGAVSLYEYSGNYKLTLIKSWDSIFKEWEWINDFKLDEPNGYLWIATTDGLYILDYKSIETAKVKKIKSLDKVNCNTLTFDHLGQLWVGSMNGLAVLQDGILIREFDESSGLISDQITTIFESKCHRLWIGTHRGLIHMPNRSLVKNIAPPITLWKQRQYNSHSKLGAIQLPIDVSALSEMSSLRLQYKLSKNSDWIDFPYQNSLTISNQPPGNYKLYLRGKTTGSEWSIPQEASLEVEGYFWEYLLFKGGIIILILISIVYYSNILVKKEKEKSSELKKILKQKTAAQDKLTRVRKEIAQDFHDEMGNKLASITVLADLAAMKIKGKDEDTEKILSRIETQSKQLYTGTRDFIWSIDAQNDELGVIYDYIKDFGEEFFDDLDIRYHTHKELAGHDQLLLPQSWSLQLVFIFKEAMTNIAKYAHATHVYLSLSIKNNLVTFSIKDNGVGISDDQMTKNGNGLKNMKARINKLGTATLNIESNTGKGTAIIIQFNTNFDE